MPAFSRVILYVDSKEKSVCFYRALLGREPVERSENFAMFSSREGAALGLWSRHAVEPVAQAGDGGTELCFVEPDADAVHAAWRDRGLPIAAPTDMDSGRTFVALDPDGHRHRVFRPS